MFDYFISLGCACSMAASMSKYGLRSCSCPFDWLITLDFSWVLYHIDTDFKDFLLQENLVSYDENPKHFMDKQSGIRFIHDQESFRDEYDILKSKYDKRIDRFLNITRQKVCYLRRVGNEEEISYIEKHSDYIRNVIRKNNPESEIVFLYEGTLSVPESFPFKYFKMKNQWSGASRRTLRAYFDYATDFLDFCGENYAGANFIRNLAVDLEKELQNETLTARRYKTLSTLITHDFSNDTFPDSVIIYGAGVIGQELYHRIKNYTKVRCFVDANKVGEEFDDIKIISSEDLEYEHGTKIIVSAAYDFENIVNILSNRYGREDIISLDDILKLEFLR